MTKNALPPVIAIVGPTASGKTATALTLAQHFPCEIISMDSAMVYRDMHIGTAKPTPEELAATPHHLIDIIDPAESWSAASFRDSTLELVKAIQARGKLPLIVGGTMMYYRSLVSGLAALPEANPVIRARLDAEAAAQGWPALHARLTQLDPDTAARFPSTDSQRIQRALEIIDITGKTVSQLLSEQEKTALPFRLIPVSLEPSDRSVLHQRIADRFDAMLAGDALIEEVRQLRARGDLHIGLPAIRCVGYRQSWQYLEGAFDRVALREKGIAATRQLAKRQLTWLRAMPERLIVDCLHPDASQLTLEIIQHYLD